MMGLRSKEVVLGLVVAMLGLVGTPTALASPAFPGVVADELGLESPPPCTLCHTVPTGGFGTADTPVGQFLRTRGLLAANVESLRTALLAAEAEGQDSDGDGVPDIEELIVGDDPNSSDSRVPEPSFGCAAAGRSPASWANGWILLLMFTWLAVRVSRSGTPVTDPACHGPQGTHAGRQQKPQRKHETC